MDYRIILVAPSSFITNEDLELVNKEKKPTLIKQVTTKEVFKEIDKPSSATEILLVPPVPYPVEASYYADSLKTMARRCNKPYGYKQRLMQLELGLLPNDLSGDLTKRTLYQVINELARRYPGKKINLEVLASEANRSSLMLSKLLVPKDITITLKTPGKNEATTIVGAGYIDPNYNVEDTLVKVETDAKDVHDQRLAANSEYYAYMDQLGQEIELPDGQLSKSGLFSIIDKIKDNNFKENINKLAKRLDTLATQWNNEHFRTNFLQTALELLRKMALQPELAAATQLDNILAEGFTLYSKLEHKELNHKLPQITAILQNFDTLLTPNENSEENRQKTIESINSLAKFDKAQHFKAAALITAASFSFLAGLGLFALVFTPLLAVSLTLVTLAASVVSPILLTGGVALTIFGASESGKVRGQEQAKSQFFKPAREVVGAFASAPVENQVESTAINP
ncbi:MAG: hypothetical protein J0I93_09360 [Legionella sp.]|nr:hypothetical protein [Legionella sp.]